MLKAVRLRCEHQENPVGLGERNPRVSWILDSDKRDIVQKSYRLQGATDASFSAVLWDTGEVRSAQSVLVEYSGPALLSSTRYFYRVRVKDNHGEESPWSGTGFFETGLLDPALWKARFVSPEDEGAGGSSAGMLMRRDFRIAGEIAFARIYSTALGVYELSMNGARLGDALLTPGWTSYSKRLLYQTWEVTDLLQQGPNALAAMLGCGWYKGDLAGWLGRRNVYGSRTALLLQLLVRYADGREELIVTDESWKAAAGPVLFSELYHGETYDARLEQVGHERAGFDDSGWHPVWALERSLAGLQAQDGPLVRRQEVLKPLRLFTTRRGELVLDFGQNLTGWVRFTARGNPGDRVVLKHAEVLDAAGNFYTENLRSARARVEYVLKGGTPESFEPHFTFQGFRYAMIEEYPGDPTIDDFQAVVIHSDMEPAGSFSCSNPLVNRLHRNILWSLKGNFVDIPTDCPQRDERLGWTGDAQVFIRTALFLVHAAPFYRKWLRDLKEDQVEGGGVPFVVPDVLSDALHNDPMIKQPHSSTGWGDAAVICPWTLYERCGDVRILAEQYESMKGWVEYMRAHAQGGVLWNSGFHFGDWVALDAKEGSYFGATPNDLTATAFYAYSTQLLARASAVLGRKKEVREYTRLHRRIVKAFREEFYTPAGRLAARTQTAHVLALAFGLAPEKHRRRTVDTLVHLLEENGGHLTTGFLGTPFLCRVLGENERLDAAYSLLTREDYPSWLYPVTRGATTIWEHWDGIKPDGSMWSPSMNSFNHYAYGAIGDWIHGVVAGLDLEEDGAGHRRILVRPRPGGGITHAKADWMTEYGRAAVSWIHEDGRMSVEITVPHNATARVVLPGVGFSSLSGAGARFAKSEGGAQALLGSGSYTFSYSLG
jgi:alpha-L-rhamnosidase